MGSLTNCLRQASEFLPSEMRDAVLQRASELRAGGMKPTDAARQAIGDTMQMHQTSMRDVEAALAEGKTLFADRPAGAAEAQAPRFAEDVRVPLDEFDTATGERKTVSANDHVAKAEAEALAVKGTAERFMEVAASCLLGVL
jgi:hypothetical protein